MENAVLDRRIKECAEPLRKLLSDLAEESLSHEQAVALGALLACLTTLDSLGQSSVEDEAIAFLRARGFIQPVPDDEADS